MAISWREFGLLYAAALFGALALTPYTYRFVRSSGRAAEVSLRRLMPAAFAQNAVLFAVVVVLGLWASRAVELGAPFIEALGPSRRPSWPRLVAS